MKNIINLRSNHFFEMMFIKVVQFVRMHKTEMI